MRKKLKKMTAQEKREWAEQRYAELSDFRKYTQQYLTKRSNRQSKGRGHRTDTDERYEQFQVLCADILEALAEIQEDAAAEE